MEETASKNDAEPPTQNVSTKKNTTDQKTKKKDDFKLMVNGAFWIGQVAISLTMLILGVKNRRNCHANPQIPIWLMQWGALILTKKFAQLFSYFMKNSLNLTERKNLHVPLNSIIVAWSILGGFLVFPTSAHFDKFHGNYYYCDPTLFKFSFAIIIIVYCCIGASVLITLIGCIFFKKYFDQIIE